MAEADQAPKADPLPEKPGEDHGAVRLAEPGQRLLARIVDTLVVGLPVVVVLREIVPAGDVEIAAPPIVAGLLLLYEWIGLALWGRTPGKRFAGIQVVRQEIPQAVSEASAADSDASENRGERAVPGRLGVARSLLRAAVYALPIAARPVPVFGLIAGLLWVGNAALMYEGTWRQALHDRLSGTIVVKRGAA
jgi:uncharacterized RDD family membrane protein YckC